MTRNRKIALAAAAAALLLVLLLIWQAAAEAPATSVRALAGTEITHLLTPGDLEDLALAPEPGQFDVTADGNVLLLSAGRIYEIESTPRSVVADALSGAAGKVDAFALDRGDAVITISAGYFGQIEADGLPSQGFPLPSPDMRVAASLARGNVYLFGGRGSSAQRLYALGSNGRIEILAELPDAIVAVADSHDAAYVATADALYRLTSKATEVRLRAGTAELGGPIVSVAASADDKTLFFATASQVFALRGDAAVTLVSNAGGALRWRDGRLFVWDRQRQLVLALAFQRANKEGEGKK
jgi:hypothetical protein